MTAPRRPGCACGRVVLEAAGPPLVAAACHCDDCQAGSRRIEALPGAPAILDAAGGTAYVLVRRDRLRLVQGGELLRGRRLSPRSRTVRVHAACCNTPLFADVAAAHWITVFRAAWDRDAAVPTPLDFRLMARFAPPGSLPIDAVPTHARAPLGLVRRLLAGWLGMLLPPRAPRLRWPLPGGRELPPEG